MQIYWLLVTKEISKQQRLSMSKNFLDLSGKIDGFTVELFETVAKVAKALGIPFFVVGATSRDMILMHGYDIRTIRATRDIDLGVRVKDWRQYEQLEVALAANGKFTATQEPHRHKYRQGVVIDVIPFGPIADADGFFTWPPEHEVAFNTLGFEDSYRHSLTVRLRSHPVLEIQSSSLAGLAAMKIIAWKDNYPSRKKDAQDLSLILRTYLEAGNEERLFENEPDLVEKEDFDYVHAGARLLGRDIMAITQPGNARAILDILNRETGEQNRYKLVEDMMGLGAVSSDDFEEKLRLLEALRSGIVDRM